MEVIGKRTFMRGFPEASLWEMRPNKGESMVGRFLGIFALKDLPGEGPLA
jgi:hypothetical protein